MEFLSQAFPHIWRYMSKFWTKKGLKILNLCIFSDFLRLFSLQILEMRPFPCNIKSEHMKNGNSISSGNFKNGKMSIFDDFFKFANFLYFSWFVGVPEDRNRVKCSPNLSFFTFLYWPAIQLWKKHSNLEFWRKSEIANVPPPAHCALWAETVFSWTFGHSLSKKKGTDVFDSLLEAYSGAGLVKMRNFQIQDILGDWSRK